MKKFKVYIPLIIVILAVVVGGVVWYLDYRKYVSTDDAVVGSDVVTVSPKVMGRIVKLYVDEGDAVREGDLLAELDSTDLYAQKLQTQAVELQAQDNKTQTIAKYDYDVQNQKVLLIALDKANDDFARAETQFSGGVITREQYDHSKKALETAQAQFDASKAALQMSKAQIGTATSGVAVSKAQVGVVDSQLRNYKLFAPCDGMIAKRWLLEGDIVQPAQSIFTVNNTTKFWVQVYLEETKMTTVRDGSEAVFTIDALPDATFTGKVYDVGSTTASEFSLIPPNNASGNFTKVTQRVPLRISIDNVSGDKHLSDYHFFTGMSTVVKIKR
ncbi:MAG: HlyD family secretion protein [Tannerella sp.]|nr:HlyD family secretion protein [Tannerella sp.]